ncbi:hypothetical protein PC129_g13093 [Phytophthora cactorum]|uniref:ARS-binding protein 1 N-terminal domain-containing protein n=1 Tax=Phytophthora cactorum TaxID=29920 RepID=A0A8T1HT52_9STRA|nr:hypothetical protein PC112_g14922 [Phytophthora cactorum]KAG2813955.1 hypothetical protein PC111_g14177 [Phytophthora cactorum]KAG2852336.1 hypothetical protein PC113_g15106 [Phytophthora cactorum]KAG2893526.1 hypothetical protein PC114_g16203 [Phytophthora cactorum]KAG2906498.1 hypothetical protein PC115_g14253 [Phytophthora cactorum]
MAVARHHLTIQEKNQLRAYHRERPDLTQEQLREWVHDKFGKWIGRSTIGKIASMPEEMCANPTAKRVQSGRYPEMEAELYEYIITKQSEEHDDEPLRDDLTILSEGTSQEYERKRELLIEVQAKLTAFEEFQEDLRKRRGEPTPPSNVTQHEAAVAKVGEVAAAIAVAEATGEADRDGQRRLELLEIKMERELAEQRRYADEQVRQLERLQRAQLEAQQNQHAQLLATIQQQQAMMLDLIKSVAAQSKKE